MSPVADHDLLDVADAFAVDEDAADGDRIELARTLGRKLQHLAVFEQEAVLLRDADRFGELDVTDQVAVFAVDRHEVARARQMEHRLQLFLRRVAGDVNLRHALVMHLRAAAVEMIDDVGDRALVSGDELGREKDGVAGLDLDRFVTVEGDAMERRERLAPAAGREKRDLIPRQVLPRLVLVQRVTREIEIAELGRDLGVVDHAAAAQDEPPSGAPRDVGDLLDARDIRRKRRDEDLSMAALEDRLEIPPDLALGRRVAFALDVGRVGKQQQDAFLSVGGELLKVEVLAAHRRLVDLEVAGVNDDACRRLDREREAIHQAVRHADAFELERPELPRPVGGDLAEIGGLLQAVLADFIFQERERQARAEDRRVDLLQDVRQRADVVFVRVREHDRAERVFPLQQVADIGDHEIDAEEVGAGEHEAAVDRDRRAGAFQQQHVEAEFAEAAERYDSYRFHALSDVQRRRGARAVQMLLRLAGGAGARLDDAAHALGERGAVFRAEPFENDRLVHEDFDLAAFQPPLFAAEDAPAAADRDRHDRRFCLHCEQKRAALEVSQTPANAAVAFGEDHHRDARGELRPGLRQARHRRRAVGAVDENVPRRYQRPAEEGDIAERLLRDPAQLEPGQALHHHRNVDVALMVRYEDICALLQPR